jgi:hypothetical protein
MKIWTSYFGNIKKIINPVSIAISPPKWYKGFEYNKLFPTWKMINDLKTNKEIDLILRINKYERAYYNEILSQLIQNDVFSDLLTLYNGEDVVLLCYESPKDFCHRHLVADWFIKAGVLVEELPKENVWKHCG